MDTHRVEEGRRSRASTCRRTPTACSRSPTTASAAANYVNLIVIDKQPQLQWLDMDAAREHARSGASIWAWAGNDAEGEEPDVVLACAGDTPTLETVAAAAWLRKHAPDAAGPRRQRRRPDGALSPREHPHGMTRRTLRGALHARHARRLRVPRLRAARSTSSSTGARARPLPRARLSARRGRRRRRSTWSC